MEPERCGWATSTPDYVAYHDEEWGVPLHGDDALFERLCLEAFQSGLSWITILRKRPAFRAAFAGFSIDAVADLTDADVERLLADAGIVRNRAKIEAARRNARAAQQVPQGLSALLWSYAPPPRPNPATLADVPAADPGVHRAGPGPQAARVRLRRADHRLRPDAGDRHGGRPRRDLFPGGPGRRRVRAHVGAPTGMRENGRQLWFSNGRTATPRPTTGARVAGEGGTHGGHEAAHG